MPRILPERHSTLPNNLPALFCGVQQLGSADPPSSLLLFAVFHGIGFSRSIQKSAVLLFLHSRIYSMPLYQTVLAPNSFVCR